MKDVSAQNFEGLTLGRPDSAGVTVVTLDRPDRFNAMDMAIFDSLERLAEAAAADPSVRGLILTGAGRAFCAGLDLDLAAGLTERSVESFLELQEIAANMIAAWRGLPKPVIAAVNGVAAGGGLCLALAADIRLAGPEARFGAAFIRLGLSGTDMGVSWLLPRVVGLGMASELMLTGRVIDADEAERIGLVNRVIRDGDLIAAAAALAAEMTANTAFGLRLTKQALQINVDAPSLRAALELENRNQALASRSQETRDAFNHFMAAQAAKRASRS